MHDYHLRLSADAMAALDQFAQRRGLSRAVAARIVIEESIFGRDRVSPTPEKPDFSFVYVVRLGDLYKIGKSDNPEKRIRSMQLPGKPAEDSFQWRTRNARRLERDLHELFAHRREHGEWFRLSADDLDLLNNVCHERTMAELTA